MTAAPEPLRLFDDDRGEVDRKSHVETGCPRRSDDALRAVARDAKLLTEAQRRLDCAKKQFAPTGAAGARNRLRASPSRPSIGPIHLDEH
jgi:hypothetical protein